MSHPDLVLPFSSPELGGGVTVTHDAIARVAGKVARSTYGVVGMQESPIRKLARFFRGSFAEGVELEVGEGQLNVGLHVIMERGVNLAQVTANLQEQVRYQLQDVGGLPVGAINVRVEDLKD